MTIVLCPIVKSWTLVCCPSRRPPWLSTCAARTRSRATVPWATWQCTQTGEIWAPASSVFAFPSITNDRFSSPFGKIIEMWYRQRSLYTLYVWCFPGKYHLRSKIMVALCFEVCKDKFDRHGGTLLSCGRFLVSHSSWETSSHHCAQLP